MDPVAGVDRSDEPKPDAPIQRQVPPNTNIRPSTPTPSAPVDPSPPSPFVAKLPVGVTLPSVSDRTTMRLGALARDANEEITLTSVSEPFELGGRTWTIKMPPNESGTRWPVFFANGEEGETLSDDSAVGEFFFEDNSLNYRWLSAARPGHIEKLQNTCVRVSVGETDQIVSLREPKKRPAVILDLESSRDVRQVEIENGPDPSQLNLEVFGLSGLRTPASFKDDKCRTWPTSAETATTGSSTR